MAIKAYFETKSPKGDMEAAGELKDSSRRELFLQCIAKFGLCIGSEVEEDVTRVWVFSSCNKSKDRKVCTISLTRVELL